MMVLSAMPWLTLGLVLSTTAAQRAPAIKDPAGELEARRFTAEKSVREIQLKAPESQQSVSEAYAAAAKTNNAWLDAVCRRVETGQGLDGELDSLSKSASDAFTSWYTARNQALNQPTNPAAAGILDISTMRLFKAVLASMPTDSRSGRTELVANLRRRLSWKAWEQITGA